MGSCSGVNCNCRGNSDPNFICRDELTVNYDCCQDDSVKTRNYATAVYLSSRFQYDSRTNYRCQVSCLAIVGTIPSQIVRNSDWPASIPPLQKTRLPVLFIHQEIHPKKCTFRSNSPPSVGNASLKSFNDSASNSGLCFNSSQSTVTLSGNRSPNTKAP